jgi:hypothetical protein
MPAALLALLLAFVAGDAIVRLLRAGGPPLSRGIRIWMSLGVGLAATSLVYFLGSLLAGVRLRWLDRTTADLLFVLAMAVLARVKRRRATPEPPPVQILLSPERPEDPDLHPPHVSSLGCVLAPIFALVLIAGAVSAILLLHDQRLGGGFDAWAIWRLHARFLLEDAGRWTTALSRLPYWEHPSYPLLLPAAMARLWSYGRRESNFAPALLAFAFLLGVVGVLVSTLSALRGRGRGLLAGIALLGTPYFIILAASEYADVPLAFYGLASAAVLAIWIETRRADVMPAPRGSGLLLLAGALAGSAAWTKDEGLVWVVAELLVLALGDRAWALRAGRSKMQGYDGQLGYGAAAWFLLGAVPGLAAVLCLKVVLVHASSALLSVAGLGTRLASPHRYRTILAGLFKYVPRTSPLIVVAFVWAWLQRPSRSPAAHLVGWVLLLIALGYLGVYLITPIDLQWLIAFSMNRLVVQLWPLALLWAFLRRPQPSR